MTFTEWLMTQDRRSDPVGDLAHDVGDDMEWDKDWEEIGDFVAHLGHGACNEAKAALSRAWGEYGYFTATWDMRWR